MHTTKFSVGQQVWLLHANKAMCGTICKVHLIVTEEPVRNSVQEYYNIEYIKPKPDEIYVKPVVRTDVSADLLYATREELLNSL